MAILGQCFCCSLHSGVSILGWTFLIMHLVMLVTYFLPNYHTHLGEDVHRYFNHDPQNDCVSSIISCVVGVIANATLLYGSHREKRLMLLPWLISYGPGIFLLPIVFFFGGISMFVGKETMENEVVVYTVALSIAALFIYCWFCVLSLYQQFNTKDMQKRAAIHDKLNLMNDTLPINNMPPPYDASYNVQSV